MSPPPLRTVVVAVSCSVAAGVMLRGSNTRPVTPYSPAPVSLEVPAPPVPVQAAGRLTLVYELHVAESGSRPLRLERVEVRDADRPNASPVATLGRSEIERSTKLIAPRGGTPGQSVDARYTGGGLPLAHVRLVGCRAARAHASRRVRGRKYGRRSVSHRASGD